MIELIPCPFSAVKQNGMKRTKHLSVRSVERQFHLLGVFFENILIRIIDTANIWLDFGIGGLTMAEYIELETLLERAEYDNNYRLVIPAEAIKAAPAADVVPVVHGRWAHLGGDEWCCSACGFVLTTEGSWDKPTKKYCEDCGAKMDGDARNS